MTLRDYQAENLRVFPHSPKSPSRARFGPDFAPTLKPTSPSEGLVITGSNPSTAANAAVTRATRTSIAAPGSGDTFDLSGVNADGEPYAVFRFTVQGRQYQVDFANVGLSNLSAVTPLDIAKVLTGMKHFTDYAFASTGSGGTTLVITTRAYSTLASIVIADFGANDKFQFSTSEANGTGPYILFTLSCVHPSGQVATGTPIRIYGYDASTGTTLEANAKLMVVAGEMIEGYATNDIVAAPSNGVLTVAWADDGTGAEALHLEFGTYPDTGGYLNKPSTRITSSFT